MAELIYKLEHIRRDDIALVGGKAANLGDLARGLDVPPGFCLSSTAYSQHLEHYGINEKINDLVASLDVGNIQDLDRVSAEISGMITKNPIVPETVQVIEKAYKELAGDREIKVAVRSSATAEDLADASFAGLQETFLNVEGFPNVLEAIKKCWASLWTSRAIYYRTQKGFDHDSVRMAVIIQEMIPAVVSGVMFTANPVTNSREEILIEAVRGLGEQLVSGQTAGDVYVFKKGEARVDLLRQTVADQRLGPMLNDYDARELAHTGLKIEKFYEDYQDIEWAYYRGKFYFLQTRPITTLADEELRDVNIAKMNKHQREVLDWVAERFPDPIHPIDGVVVKVLLMAQFEAMQSYGYSIEEMDWTRVDRGMFPEFFEPPRIRASYKRLLLYLRLGKILRSDPAAEWAAEQIYLLDTLRKLKGRDISKLPFEIIIDYITEGFNHLHFFFVMRYNYFTQNRIPSSILLKLLRFLFKEQGPRIYDALLAGSDNITLKINRELWDLAQSANRNQEVRKILLESPLDEMEENLRSVPEGAAFLSRFNEFLEEYGERETSMGLGGIASPTWKDEPGVVYGMIRGMLLEDPGAVEAREKARKERSLAAEELVKKRLSSGILSIFPLQNFFFKLLKHARSFAAFRENSHYDVTRSLHVFRILFLELGKRFVRQGLLKDPWDIVYLSYWEIKDIIFTIYHGVQDIKTKELWAKIESRKAEQERRIKRWQMRNVQFADSDVVKGVPVSQGIATGPARIIKEPREFHRVTKGDIIIAPYTNPAWTPLFAIAAGLVVETGGAASHAAIIAREYGIPAVMGVTKATELLKDGDTITIDGSAGTVYRQSLGESIGEG